MEKKTYLTTEKAGRSVAGRVVPLETDRPKIGFEIELTASEAEYELLLGTIVEKAADKPVARNRAQPADEAKG